MAEASKIANNRRLVAVTDGSQREPTGGPTGGWRQRSVVEVVVVIAVKCNSCSGSGSAVKLYLLYLLYLL